MRLFMLPFKLGGIYTKQEVIDDFSNNAISAESVRNYLCPTTADKQQNLVLKINTEIFVKY